eukprot:TRINITY_DN11346_c0_g1_i1.p1 TRINITY_DN11346_c0_g1~~TRINITY_DN11346_c0_g1_i1.p1  ORF type:complete len:391 (-),score=41.37 TRINITY_DN11346_c0_g1_i1:955-2127(-)
MQMMHEVMEQSPAMNPMPHPNVCTGQQLQQQGSGGIAGEIRIVVPCQQTMVGRVIGRSGDTIRALQQASQAKIVVNQEFPDGVPREVHISGSAEAVRRGESMVNELINGSATSVQTVIIKYGIGETRVIDCPKSMVGKVIGKGGETIKMLQRETGASVQIDQTSEPCKITVTGMHNNVDKAIHQLSAVMYSPQGSQGYGSVQGSMQGESSSPQPGFQSQYPYGAASSYSSYPGQGQAQAPGGAGAANYPPYYSQSPGTQHYPGYPQQGQMYVQPGYGQPVPGQPGMHGSGSFPGAQGGGMQGPGGYVPGATQGMGMMPQQQVGGPASLQAGAATEVSQMQAGAAMPQTQSNAPRQAGPWQEIFDSENRPYYFNVVSGVSQWDKPPEFQHY